jgi:hypothetical protein
VDSLKRKWVDRGPEDRRRIQGICHIRHGPPDRGVEQDEINCQLAGKSRRIPFLKSRALLLPIRTAGFKGFEYRALSSGLRWIIFSLSRAG